MSGFEGRCGAFCARRELDTRIAALEAEVARLREALIALLDEADGFNVSGVYFGEEKSADQAIKKARAALEPGNG